MNEIIDPLNTIAKKNFGIDYIFPFQRLVISNILKAAKVEGFSPEHSDEDETSPHQIVLLPTGAGKSLCFMLPTVLLNGITLVIFPLLSLMTDQLRRTEEAGINSVIIRGGQSKQERKEIYKRCKSGNVKMILTNPETALTDEVLNEMNKMNITHLVIDETHTVSEWGESFRPAYLQIYSIIEKLDIDLVTAFTATASPLILQKIKKIIFPETTPNIVYGNPDRTNISYSVIRTISPTQTLISQIKKAARPLIIFSSSRTGTELTARMLRRSLNDNNVFFYHAGLSKEEKNDVESWFFDSDKGILVATCAYGMGVDKSNIRTVIHIDLPSTVESYLQESGRGGRDRAPAKGILIYKEKDNERLEKITDPVSKERFSAMIDYATNIEECRRETLLAMLGSEPEICSGCDVCDETFLDVDNKELILSVLRKNRRRFTVHDAVYFFKGYKSREIRDQQIHRLQYFGMLHDWDTDNIREAIEYLLKIGEMRLGRIFWRGLIC